MAQTLEVPSSRIDEEPRPRLWTREEYHRMAEVGLLPEGPGTELIDGVIYEKMPQGRPHSITIRLVCLSLRAALGEGFDVASQAPLPLESSEPEPDVVVLRGGPRDYEDHDPHSATDVVLAVEVSLSSLAFDRRRKAALYARHGVPEHWIVDVAGRTVEIRRGPGAEGYAETRVYAEGETVPVGSGVVSVGDVLPKAPVG